ncbi:hypothetical protein VMCG_10468 [Cytospora schulzeri]|uniref:Uncharacterized protein n=1 Tax=Cytospora schulzeri TaxID=448051 RepID=A0A423VBZ2_9PEZI|nr:hypothetical protein VMCG_10468 [Valsa malicola]
MVVPLASKGGGRGSCRSRSSGLTSLSSIFRLAGVEARSGLVADGGGAATWPEGPEIEAWDRWPALEGRLGTRVLGLTLRLRSRSLWDSDRRFGEAALGDPKRRRALRRSRKAGARRKESGGWEGIRAIEDEEEYEEKLVAAAGKADMFLLRKGGAAGMDFGVAQKLLSLQIVVVGRLIKVGQEVLRAVRAGAYDRTEIEQATPG